MPIKYIARSTDLTSNGFWGVGDTSREAKAHLREVGGKAHRCQVERFFSSLPFAPVDRPANGDEADCWIDRYGASNWIRCEREIMPD